MKKLSVIIILSLFPFLLFSQCITGQWNGLLEVQNTQLRVVFHIVKTDSGYSATMDSPDQGAEGIPVTSANFENSVLKLEIKNLKVEYTGKLNEENIFTGNFIQAGQSFSMNLSREKLEKKKLFRPQEPKPPYSYYTEDVKFKNEKDDVILAGTLTFPKGKGKFPAVILISGSGPQDRNEEVFGHKPFLVIADYLTEKGIAVLRYDDRGIGESAGNFDKATSNDFAKDVLAAINFLKSRKEINHKQIGLIGHSEGGIIAPMVAAESDNAAFIILLAGTGIPGDEVILLQQKLSGKAYGADEKIISINDSITRKAFAIIKSEKDDKSAKIKLTEFLKTTLLGLPESMRVPADKEDAFIENEVNRMVNPWFRYFINYDPAAALEKVKCPVLSLNGEKDLQVPAQINQDAIKQALEKGGNKNYTIKQLKGLNHLFQEAKTGTASEYEKIEQSFSPVALNEISDWIFNIIKK